MHFFFGGLLQAIYDGYCRHKWRKADLKAEKEQQRKDDAKRKRDLDWELQEIRAKGELQNELYQQKFLIETQQTLSRIWSVNELRNKIIADNQLQLLANQTQNAIDNQDVNAAVARLENLSARLGLDK